MKILFIDNRASIVEKVKAIGIDAIYGNYFEEILKIDNHVICSASNPQWVPAGGFDRQLSEYFPLYFKQKQRIGGDNQRIGNICFVISVNNRIQSNAELVRKALNFAIDMTGDDETLCIMGIGCGIGNLPEREFVQILADIIK